MLQNGRFADLRGFDREQIICRLHGRPTSVRPRWAVKRFPMRLLTDYGEGKIYFYLFYLNFILRNLRQYA